MKHRLLSLVSIVALALSVFSIAAIPQASADDPSGDGMNHLFAQLKNTSNPQQYTLQGTHVVNGKQQNVSFSYDSGKKGFMSQSLPGTGSDCISSPQLKQVNTIKVTAKVGGGVAGSTTYDFCGHGQPFVRYITMTVSPPSDAKKPASFTGTVTYTSDAGGKKTFDNSATGTLKNTDTGKTYPIEFNDEGQITKTDNLPPGNYTFTADFLPQNPMDGAANRHVETSFKLKEGENKVLNLNADKANEGANDPKADPQSDPSEPNINCNTNFNPLTWLICPTVHGMVNIVNQIDNVIAKELSVGSPGDSDDPNQIFCSPGSKDNLKTKSGGTIKSCEAYHDAWSAVRNIALGLMVIAGLIVLIAQALGFEFLDAYTIRKVLPRILIAAIAITLSWQLMQFFVRFTNDLGFGVRWLLFQPFGGIQNSTLSGGGLAAVNLIAGGAILALGIFGLLSFAITAALAVAVAFLVFVIRDLLIIVLVIFAPVAIVAYILPNTQNIYKLWWDSFAKALLVFPIIAAFIAAGRVFSLVANTGSAIGQLIGFVAYFAPYFLLPMTFRFAGGALRGIGGFVNDRSRGGFDRLKKYRGAKAARNWELMRTNQRFNANRGGVIGRVNKRANSLLSSATDPGSAAKIYGGMALRKAGLSNSLGSGILSSIDQTKFVHSQKLAQKMNTDFGFNDRALTALMRMEDFSAGSIRRTAEGMLDSSDESTRLGGQQLLNHGAWLAQSMHHDDEMRRADISAAAGLAVTAQGFGNVDEITDVANRLGPNSGLASAFVTQAQLNGQRAGRLDMKPGYGIQMGRDPVTGERRFFSAGAATLAAGGDEAQKRAIAHQMRRVLSSGSADFQSAKAGSVRDLGPGIQQLLNTTGLTKDDNGQYVYEYMNENNERDRIRFTDGEVERVAAMLGNAQSDFAGTSPQTAAAIAAVVDEARPLMSEQVNRAYSGARRDTSDPVYQAMMRQAAEAGQRGQGDQEGGGTQ